MEQQNTIKSKLTLSGKGLHFGKDVTVSILPANANTGINFCRIDLDQKPIIPALIDNVTDTSRGTTLEKNGVKIATMEHLMASLHYFNIDNALIEIDSEEVPILDGSSKL
ncbi:MAG TPA: UDP-3-O-[3-hydroxymyristoyl] N-acetylglucosamine deacetylase, partial [Bacteroidales bacterium]|nr:UDP-3-O-[3-hydroxymyristoyl] N-acetylglucosamine deacetylase [Bacteroidales bacterium]